MTVWRYLIILDLTNRQQFSMVCTLIKHRKAVKMCKTQVEPWAVSEWFHCTISTSIFVEVSQLQIAHSRKRKTKCATITLFPWSLPSIIEHSSEKSPSYCKNGYFFTHNRKAIKTHGEITTRLWTNCCNFSKLCRFRYSGDAIKVFFSESLIWLCSFQT